MVNRSALVIKVKQPFLDWLRSLSDPTDATLQEVNSDTIVYLLADGPDDAQDETIELFYNLIFEHLLNSWWTEKQDWPPARDYAMFKQWFDVELHSTVHDLVDAPLEDDYAEL
jgi:hypothetical protein